MNGPSLRPIGPSARRQCVSVKVGHVTIGGGSPIVVQSMTNTDTADVTSTAEQVAQLARAGSEIVRITVDRREAAAAVPYIRDELERKGLNVPLVGDFHYIGHRLLTEFPACAKALDKYRINPGNVGHREKRDSQFSTMVEIAARYEKPVRIGVIFLLSLFMSLNRASTARSMLLSISVKIRSGLLERTIDSYSLCLVSKVACSFESNRVFYCTVKTCTS